MKSVLKSRAISFALSALLALFLCLGFVLGTVTSRTPAYRYLSVFAEVLGLVRSNYVDEVESGDLLHGAYQGLLAGLDPYSAYLPREEFARFSKEPEGPADPGFEAVKLGGSLVVVSLWPGSPADKAGMRIGDLIWTVDGRTTRDLSLQQARRLLSGPPDTEVVVQLYRGAERKRHELRLVRVRNAGRPFESRLEAPGIGYLRVRDLARAERNAVAGALADLQKRGARTLLVDLRGATRGGLPDAQRLAGLFVGDSVLARSRERGGAEIEHRARGPAVWTETLWLLVNKGTAGPAEIVTGALRDGAGATLLGESTCGQGARQELLPLPSGDGILLSVARYLTPSGEAWSGQGLSVDREIPLTLDERSAGGEEIQLRRALEIIVEEAKAGSARAA